MGGSSSKLLRFWTEKFEACESEKELRWAGWDLKGERNLDDDDLAVLRDVYARRLESIRSSEWDSDLDRAISRFDEPPRKFIPLVGGSPYSTKPYTPPPVPRGIVAKKRKLCERCGSAFVLPELGSEFCWECTNGITTIG